MDVRGLFTRRLLKWAVIITLAMSLLSGAWTEPYHFAGYVVGGVILWTVLLAAGKAVRAVLDRRLGYA
ncbi:hypothetical protein [Haloplanus rubicundus]|uniref:Uncharacterized protein n=1 Tax=Haloplanus rubicundus TaxID=1547898 RepID=A0A345EHI3_9EURY|nr:hypothetical protein [Haloplanus rubicundus]AXG11655.1 hypothetical protein DU484_18330 [Haloplanus rubicundus]